MSSEFDHALKLIEEEDSSAFDEYLTVYPELLFMVKDGATLLNHAAASGSSVMVEVLLDNKALIDNPQSCPSTALHWAASLNLVDICEKLIERGASLDVSDGQGEGGTPLVQALFYGHVEAAEALARHKIVPENLRVAAGLGRIEMMESFFYFNGKLRKQAGNSRQWYRANDEFPEKPTSDSEQEILDEALCYACFNDRLDAVKFLIEKGSDPNAKPFYATALHFAVAKNNLEMVDFLLESGADPLILDDNYMSTAYGWAEWGRADEVADRLLGIMEEIDLVYAVNSGNVEKVEELIEAASKREIEGEKGKQALLKAIELENDELETLLRNKGARLCMGTASQIGSLEDVSFLIGQGISPNSTLTVSTAEPGSHSIAKEISALLLAAINRHEAVASKLQEAGAKVDIYCASALNMVDKVSELLSSGTKIDRVDAFGKTPLHRAIQGNAFDVVEMLLEGGASVERTSDLFTFGPRAIHVAASSGASPEIIEILLEYGADINEESNTGTPLDCALREDQTETVEFLRELGASESG